MLFNQANSLLLNYGSLPPFVMMHCDWYLIFFFSFVFCAKFSVDVKVIRVAEK